METHALIATRLMISTMTLCGATCFRGRFFFPTDLFFCSAEMPVGEKEAD
jgi:hypothetical protein